MTEDEELEALYAAPLASFIDLRKAAAQRLRAAGDKESAARVLATAKPTPAAWAVNQLWRKSIDAFTALLDAGDELRAALREAFAGRGLAGAPAALQKTQRDAVAALVATAASELEASGTSASQPVLDRVATTLRSISTTGSWGDALPGRLPRELGEADLASIATLLVDDKAPRPVRPAASAQPSRLPKKPPASSHERRVGGGSAATAPSKNAAATKAEEARRAKELARLGAEVEVAAADERGARKAVADARVLADGATAERATAQRHLETARTRSEALHQAAEEAARAAKEALLEVKKSADAVAALERGEVASGRALRSAGIAMEQAETRLAAARAARDEASSR